MKLPKCSITPILISTFSFLLCLSINAHAGRIKSTAAKNSSAILQKIAEFCKQNSLKKIKKNKNFANQAVYQLQQAATGGLSKQIWHNINLIPYLQQANTQINSDSSVIALATKGSLLPHHNNPLNEVAADTLLEELLGVHTFIQSTTPEQVSSRWANFSFDCSIGLGAVFYTNQLEQIHLLQRKKGNYFFITQTNEVYKPNWFHDTLDQVRGFNRSNHTAYGRVTNTAFQGKGLGLPITLGIQYICWKQLFVGIGREMLFNRTDKLIHNDDDITYKAYILHKKWSTQGRWFVKCGWYMFSDQKHRFFGDMRLFYVQHLGHIFSKLVTFGPYLHQALAYNLGLGYERQFTDYLSCIMRLSMEKQKFKQFTDTKSHDYNIQYKQPALYLQVGLSIRPIKYTPYKTLKCKERQCKDNTLNDITKLEGLQELLEAD
ncbi:hypothetical protein [Cardinium endosymbiont of Sogatella furcifera]|uniref:hypothetical protein n=1 Tax=Cardinium endosymbiont of Sogatella furcifera TaxID=650378 RepID=UPI0013B3FC04|nr:hypothetical protein [Cardinium endosymbiont of Sogatella furcifera]